MKLVEIRINCPDHATAARIAERLVAARLAASANIGSGIESIYRWRGAVERVGEVPLLVKTRAGHFAAVAAEAAALHPYEVPAITATELATTDAYGEWIVAETGARTGLSLGGRSVHPARQEQRWRAASSAAVKPLSEKTSRVVVPREDSPVTRASDPARKAAVIWSSSAPDCVQAFSPLVNSV